MACATSPAGGGSVGAPIGATPFDAGGSADAKAQQPACVDECATGAKKCSGNGLQSCIVGPKGCLIYGPPADCGQNNTCKEGQCAAGCKNECVEGVSQCAAGGVKACTKEANGCTKLSGVSACAAGEGCEGGKCVQSCFDDCDGTPVCTASGQIQACKKAADGCLHLETATSCPGGTVCSDGKCSGCEYNFQCDNASICYVGKCSEAAGKPYVFHFSSGKIPPLSADGTGWDAFDKPDVYVVLRVDGEVVGKTSVAKETFEPIWAQDMPAVTIWASTKIEVELWESDATGDDYIDGATWKNPIGLVHEGWFSSTGEGGSDGPQKSLYPGSTSKLFFGVKAK